jgi:hypothetical protein
MPRADPTDPNRFDADKPHPDGVACGSNKASFDRFRTQSSPGPDTPVAGAA